MLLNEFRNRDSTQESVMRAFIFFMLLSPLAAFAQELPAPRQDVLNLDASASAEVTYDEAIATLAYDAQGAAAAELDDAASRAIGSALKEAKQVKEVTARTGQFSSFPVYGKDQQVTGWRVRAELVIESSDFKALSELTGRLAGKLAVGNVNYVLSTATRKAIEAKLTGDAIAAYRDKAQAAARNFGYAKYRIREVTVGSGGAVQPRAMGMQLAGKFAQAAPLPIEAGSATVTVTVSGSVQMLP
jgi:predicted secreted protein